MNFHCDIPFDVFGMVEEALIPKKGIEWAIKQCKELIEFGVPCLHFYVMNTAKSVIEVVKCLI